MKAKKIILPIFLTLICVMSSLMLFGCDKKVTPANTHKLFEETITTFKNDSDLFSTGTININLKTSFNLKYLDQSKPDPISNFEYNYLNYNILVAYGLNFIDKYYPMLKSTNAKFKFKKMNESITAMKNSYYSVKNESEKLKNASSDLNNIVINGYFFNYRVQVVNFINNIYDCANKLGDFLNNNAKVTSTIGTANMTSDVLSFYIDYNMLRLFDDFRIFYSTSCKGVALNDTLYSNATFNFKYMASSAVELNTKMINQFNEVEEGTTFELSKQFKHFMDILGMYKNTSESTRKALNDFSMYDYLNKYNGDIKAYLKDNENAEIYLERIKSQLIENQCEVRLISSYISNNF